MERLVERGRISISISGLHLYAWLPDFSLCLFTGGPRLLLGSTVNLPASLSSLRFHFSQAQTLLAAVWREGWSGEADTGEIWEQREFRQPSQQEKQRAEADPVLKRRLPRPGIAEISPGNVGGSGGGRNVCFWARWLLCMNAEQTTQLSGLSLTRTQAALDICVSIFMTTGGLRRLKGHSSLFD